MDNQGSGIVSVKVEDDVIKVKASGDVKKSVGDKNIGVLIEAIRAERTLGRRSLLLIDVGEVDKVCLDGRRRVQKLFRSCPDRIAFYGAGINLKLLFKFIAMVSKYRNIGIFSTEAEARKYLRSKS